MALSLGEMGFEVSSSTGLKITRPGSNAASALSTPTQSSPDWGELRAARLTRQNRTGNVELSSPKFCPPPPVPELAVMLIHEDMKVCDETARQILQVSVHLGETLHDNV